ncbi:Oidioi.mRNA.OKI2018_I69.chr1.g3756.t1.cds [Oikopleura dioica]|uniref:Oidioi.mRNA.OKI2018_I69.chr1.g3756.t1.cds n=1 Tax=Oikopleura dioica TaxID=34765 RepID=A0ABN7SYP4_OIKDI|nr:Oidioi.mRNA.OKI2018_I69.chr1.g3756.t1.cds [Oikopleura dioica]
MRDLLQAINCGSGIVADNTIYLFPGNTYGVRIIQRLQIEDDKIRSVDIIGSHERAYPRPIVFFTTINYCSA